jgi:hypothetical protein
VELADLVPRAAAAPAARDLRSRSGRRDRRGGRTRARLEGGGAGVREPGALLRRMPCLPQRRYAQLHLLHLQRLLRFLAEIAQDVRGLPLRWPLRIHDRAAILAGAAPRERQL